MSVMALASFARVFPVQGATTKQSSNPCGPMGSTSTKLSKGLWPVISSNRADQSSGLPKRVVMLATEGDHIGVTAAPSRTNSSRGENTSSKVQWEPVSAKPILFPAKRMLITPAPSALGVLIIYGLGI